MVNDGALDDVLGVEPIGSVVDPTSTSILTAAILIEILHERERQNVRWGKQRHQWGDWMLILGEEVGELSQALLNLRFFRNEQDDGSQICHAFSEAIQVAAVATEIAEHLREIGKNETTGTI